MKVVVFLGWTPTTRTEVVEELCEIVVGFVGVNLEDQG